MPRGDRTGPMGQGPMTGRGMGFCTGYDTPGYANSPGFFGRGGFGRGRGFGVGYFGRSAPGMGGRGRGNMYRFNATGVPGWQLNPGFDPRYQPQMSKEQELDLLRNHADMIEKEKQGIDQRIKELESTD